MIKTLPTMVRLQKEEEMTRTHDIKTSLQGALYTICMSK
jgi:hypothetical protein